MLLLKNPKKNLSLPPPARWSMAFSFPTPGLLAHGSITQSLPLFAQDFFPCVSNLPLLSFIRTPVICFWVFPKSRIILFSDI
jgi:hypothetical protein